MSNGHEEHQERIAPKDCTYILVTLALVALSVFALAVSMLDAGPWSFSVAIIISFTQAALLMTFLMNLINTGKGMILLYAFLPFVLLAILVGICYVDYFQNLPTQALHNPSPATTISH